jgi:hypothetical protein
MLSFSKFEYSFRNRVSLKIKKNDVSLLNGNLNKTSNIMLSNSSSLMSSTSSSTSSLAINSNMVSNSGGRVNANIFNEIITKRIKYSPFASTSNKNVNGMNPSSLNHSPYLESSLSGLNRMKNSNLVSSNQTNGFEITKPITAGSLSTSLDSSKNNTSETLNDILPNKSSNYSQENLSSIQDNLVFSPLSPPNIFKKKRKKKDNSSVTVNTELTEKNERFFRATSFDQQANARLTSNTLTHLNSLKALNSQLNSFYADQLGMNSSAEAVNDNPLKTLKSFKLNDDQIDSLQHMKNLDLNNDRGKSFALSFKLFFDVFIIFFCNLKFKMKQT